MRSSCNQLYRERPGGEVDRSHSDTVLGQYHRFQASPGSTQSGPGPFWRCAGIVELLRAHPSARLDPKYHLLGGGRVGQSPLPARVRKYALGELLVRRKEVVFPTTQPDSEFLTLSLSRDGVLSSQEAGKGNNSPSWYGAYFPAGSRWYLVYVLDLVVSRIDLWRGCAAVVPPEFDQAIVTGEFPAYLVDTRRVDPAYLALLLCSMCVRDLLAALSTCHSNHRRVQPSDFLALEAFLPEISLQRASPWRSSGPVGGCLRRRSA